MPFKKLHPQLQEKLASFQIESPTPLQCKSIPVIKSGINVFCTAPKDSGKTTTLILTTLNRLKFEAVGNAPRAVVLAQDKERAIELYVAFLAYTQHTPLRVYVGHEQLHVDIQKSEIFMGIDILISTPKSMNTLFLMNGVSISELKIFSVDDAEFLVKQSAYAAMLSITQSIKKCQYVLYAEKMHPMLRRFEDHFMEYSKKIRL
ncbi:DEAD/DEAH box helicase [Jejudonia soesokkakensis]